MCLIPLSPIKIADKDMTVYKVLCREGKIFASPYRGTRWNIGETKTVGFFGDDSIIKRRFKKKLPNLSRLTIGRGLHAYTVKTNLRGKGWAFGCGDVVVRCTIPKGTPYILGYNKEIVSLALRLDKVVSPPRTKVRSKRTK